MTAPNNKPAAVATATGFAHQSNGDHFTTGNSAQAQRNRLLSRLHVGAITTIEARRELDILMPAARVHELRHRCRHNIQTIWIKQATDCGKLHRVALYQLQSGEWCGDLSYEAT